MRPLGNLLGALALAISLGLGCGEVAHGDVAGRVIDLERRLTTTCACHPRKIDGLPIQKAIRADLRAWLEEGKDEDEILWLAFSRYGRELLAAGVDDLEGLARAAAGIVGFIGVSGFAALVWNLRRRPPTPGRG